ncbi:hypothetical protein NL676_020938 [Syzygium grande]|nr:hypothetical protein NL676_020938 [Syzygium grande]
MDGDRESIKIDDDKIWEQRRARLKALESVVNERQLPLESKYRVYMLLCTAAKEGNVDQFIEALEKYSAEERVSLSNIIGIQGPSGNSLFHIAAGNEKADILRALLEVFQKERLYPKENKGEKEPAVLGSRDGGLEESHAFDGSGGWACSRLVPSSRSRDSRKDRNAERDISNGNTVLYVAGISSC